MARLNTDNRDTMPITDATYGRKSNHEKHKQDKKYEPRHHKFRVKMADETLKLLMEMVK